MRQDQQNTHLLFNPSYSYSGNHFIKIGKKIYFYFSKGK